MAQSLSNRTSVAFGLLLILTHACGQELPISTDTFTHKDPQIGGQASTEKYLDAVVAITDENMQVFCSGTYIGAKTVLTAAHCLNGSDAVKIYFGVKPSLDQEKCSQGIADACNHFISSSYKVLHPKFDPKKLSNDIALLELVSEPQGVKPIPYLPTFLALKDQDKQLLPLELTGFGLTENQTSAPQFMRLSSYNLLEGFGPTTFEGFLLESNQIYYYQKNGGPCQGDSGGPAVIERQGMHFLAGITSFGDITCKNYGISTRVDQYGDFISDFLARNYGYSPDTENPQIVFASLIDRQIVESSSTIIIDAKDNLAIERVLLIIDHKTTHETTEEPFVFENVTLAPGYHDLTALAVDGYGNTSAETLTVAVAKLETNLPTKIRSIDNCAQLPLASPMIMFMICFVMLLQKCFRNRKTAGG